MGGYIGAKTGTLVASASDIRGDISATDTTPEITLKNTTETDADGTRSGKITFKGEQSGGEESVLAQIQGSHDGTADDEKGDLIFKTNDGNDALAPTERLRINSAGDVLVSSPDPSLTITNTTHEDTDGGRESTIVFKGEQSGGELSTLAEIEASHDGTADDEKGDLIFKTNDGSDGASPTERLRLDSAGFVGINESAPSGILHVKGTSAAHGKVIVEAGGSGGSANNNFVEFNKHDGTKLAEIEVGETVTDGGDIVLKTTPASGSVTERVRIDNAGKTTLTNTSAGASTTPFVLHNASSNANTDVRMLLAPCTTAADRPVILAATNNGSNVCAFTVSTPNGGTPTERLRVDGTGNVFIGKTAEVSTQDGFQFKQTGECIAGRGSNDTIFVFQDTNSSGATVGSISITASNTAYNTSSDYRLKENITDVSDGITRLKQLSPKRFNFIVDADTTVDGFIAHEVAAVIPEAITGEKDAVDDDGNIKPQGIDQSKLVPLLTAALQEAIAKIETLETKVAALEAE